MTLKVLGVGGSMREGSASTRALFQVLDHARAHGAEARLLDLREAALPFFRPDVRDCPEVVGQVAELVRWADVLILASPDYHGSMSGVMKNFLDYHWHEFAGKLFGYICASHEKGLTAIDQMRTAVRQCYGWSLPYGVSIHRHEDLEPDGSPNPRLAARLAMTARDLVVYGALLRRQFLSDVEAGAGETFAARYGASS